MKVYSLFDQKAKIYFNPFVAATDDVAIRNCVSSMTYSREFFNIKDNLSLLCVGEWDVDSGTLTQIPREDRFVCDLSSYDPIEYDKLGLLTFEQVLDVLRSDSSPDQKINLLFAKIGYPNVGGTNDEI